MPDADAHEQRWTRLGARNAPAQTLWFDVADGSLVGVGRQPSGSVIGAEYVPAARLAEVERELEEARRELHDRGYWRTAALDSANAALESAREALRFYADEANWNEREVDHFDDETGFYTGTERIPVAVSPHAASVALDALPDLNETTAEEET